MRKTEQSLNKKTTYAFNLHDAVVSDTGTYRKDMIANLLRIVELLDMEEVVIDVPDRNQKDHENTRLKISILSDGGMVSKN